MPPPKPDLGDFNLAFMKLGARLHCFFYRLTGGRIGDKNRSILLLTTVGRKSGKRRINPLIYVPTERGYAVAGSNAGADRNPAWYINLEASHQADIQVRHKRLHVRAETVGAERRKLLWPQLVAIYPPTRSTRPALLARFPLWN